MLVHSEKQLEVLGARVGRKILKFKPGQHALVFALSGELGAGKTTFLRGFARGFGIQSRITSPTFVIARRHKLPMTNNKRPTTRRYFWHLDVYRLRDAHDLVSVDFDEIISDPHNVVAVEWADRVKNAIPRHAFWIRLSHHKQGRRIIVPKELHASKKR